MSNKAITKRQAYFGDLRRRIREWDRCIEMLRIRASSVQPSAKVEYDRQVDLLVVMLSNLKENHRRLKENDKLNTRTDAIVHNTLLEMERAFVGALSKSR